MSAIWKRNWGWIVALIAFLTVAVLLICRLSISPAGRFYNKGIGSGGTAFFEFRDGNAYLLIPLHLKASEGYQTNFLGSYAKERGDWILTTTDNLRIRLKTNVRSIRLVGPGDNNEDKYPRMFSDPE